MKIDNRQRSELPLSFGINSVYPNPFNPATSVNFSLDAARSVSLTLYDTNGREVVNLFTGELTAGEHNLIFNGLNVPSGLYVLYLESTGEVDFAKVAVVK